MWRLELIRLRADNRTWYRVDYDSAPDGWTVQANLTPVSSAASVLLATTTPVEEQVRLLQLQIEELRRQLALLLATQ